MSDDRFSRLVEVFDAVRDAPAGDRDGLLDRLVGGDSALRGEVTRLLREHATVSPLDGGLPNAAAGVVMPSDSGEPESIGPYRVLERIGSGGMGVVYRARQRDPDREVALKLIRVGALSGDLRARFETERRALALMDHPSIAQIFDAGTTDDGRPYFAMEFVRGQPIVEYCDTRSLGITERIRLIIDVCRGVQHAHQKGIIHRDIKPSNILVTEVDGAPRPKIIDFGIAKPAEGGMTLSLAGAIVGTPSYMSPEQASGGAVDVDTRTDVYAIGAVLYELMTGSAPFDAGMLEKLGLAEMLRVLRDEDPPRPSLRLREDEAGSKVSAKRGTDPKTLAATLSHDIDWIVMRCLERGRSRRYVSASSVADDLSRFLANEPVSARPPSVVYRTGKLVKRYRGRVIASVSVAIALVLGLAGTTAGLVWALDEQERAERLAEAEAQAAATAQAAAEASDRDAAIAEEIIAFLVDDLIQAADPARTADRDLTVREAVMLASDQIEGKFVGRPRVELRVRSAIAQTLDQLGSPAEAEPHHRRRWAVLEEIEGESASETLLARQRLASNLMGQSRFDDAIELTLGEIELHRTHGDSSDPLLLRALGNLGVAYLQTGRYEEAAPILEETLAAKRAGLGDRDQSTLVSIHNLSGLYGQLRQHERGVELAREAYEGRLEVLGPGDPRTFGSLNLIAWHLTESDRLDEATDAIREAFTQATDRLGPGHRQTSAIARTLVTILIRTDDLVEAERIARQTLEAVLETLGDENVESATTRALLANTIRRQGRFADSVEHSERAVETARAVFAETSPAFAEYLTSYAQDLIGLDRFQDAERALLEAHAIVEASGDRARRLPQFAARLADLYDAWNDAEPAQERAAAALSWREQANNR